MKKLIIVLAILAIAVCANAWTLSWDTDPMREGVILKYRAMGETSYTESDIGNVNEVELDSLSLVNGTRYEFILQGYAGTPRSLSGESDTLRWTYPSVPGVIEIMERPKWAMPIKE